MSDKVLEFYVPCSEEFLDKKLAELPRYGWDEQSLNAVKKVWEQVKDLNETSPSIEVNSQALQDAIRVWVISVYSSRFWFDAFEGQCKFLSPFKPYPSVPTLYSNDGKPHYLWLAIELKEALLQLWLYCDQDESRFNKAVEKVWDQYGQYSKFEAGYGGAADRFAAALRSAADS